MAWLLALILLAHDHESNRWVSFEICQVDRSQFPPVARPSPDHGVLVIRSDAILAISKIVPAPVGIQCTEIGALRHQIFVVGTRAQVMKKLGIDRKPD